MHCLTYLALEALVRYLALKITALELFFGSMICLFNLRLWTGFLCVLRLCFVWPVQGHETWHTVLFLIWFGYPCSWLWACLSTTYTAYAKAHYLQHRLLGVRRSETGHCFVFVSWCQCFWLSAVHRFFEFAFIFDYCQFTVSIVFCHMEASSGGLFTVPSACGYPHYCLFSQFVYDSVSYYLGYMICSDILLMISINGSGVLLTPHCPIAFFC